MNPYKIRILVDHLILTIQHLQQDKSIQTYIEDVYYKELIESLTPDKQSLIKKLIHALTLVNKQFREEQNGVYYSTHEDILTALELVQSIIKPKSILTREEEKYLLVLEEHFLGASFTRKQAEAITGLAKTQTHKILIKLEQNGYIQQSAGNQKTGYVYNFGIEKQDLFEDFLDNENIEFQGLGFLE